MQEYIEKEFGDGEYAPTDDSQVLDILLQPLHGDLVIRISGLSILKTADLEKEIKRIIRTKKSSLSTAFRCSYGGKITDGMRYKEVKRYLEVYDRIAALKEKKLSWEQIGKVFYPNTARNLKDGNLSLKDHDRNLKKLESHQRRLKMEYAKAKKIISNAEKGQFPGKY